MGTPTAAPRMRVNSPDALRIAMKLRGVSLQVVAGRAGVSKGFVSHLTEGRATTCTRRVAESFVELLDIPMAELFVPVASADSGRNITNQQTKKEDAA